MFRAVERDGAARALVEALTASDVHMLPQLQRRRAIRLAVTAMKQWPAADVVRFEGDLDRALADADLRVNDNGDDRFMDWSDVARLAPPSLLSVAAHGCSHAPLTSVSAENAKAELVAARERLEAAIGQPISAIAYPNGNYDAMVVQLARETGYRIGFTTQRGLVSQGDEALKLRRLNVHDAATRSMPELLCIILGVFQKWPHQV
jgi:peptidoglycan/xylan/chitin deacetylase (PgdA/CDA1 family)